MLLTVDEMVKLVRDSLNIQLPDGSGGSIIDPLYMEMTDDDIKLYIKLGVSRAYPDITDLSELPDDCTEYAFVLLAQIELYTKLAVLRADMVDIGADGAYIRKNQRFDHYMELAKQAQSSYDTWVENESIATHQVNSFDVLLAERHFTRRNYEKQKAPRVRIVIDSVTSEDISCHWGISNSSKFGCYVVYISKTPIVDLHRDGAYYKDKVDDNATLVKKVFNIRDNYCEIGSLDPETDYHLAVISVERNQVFGYSEVSFTTLEEFSEEIEADNN